MGEWQVAYEFFNQHLPLTVLEKLNMQTLKLENHSFIDEHYKSSEADVIYSVTMGNAKSYLFLLCEHQSTVDPLIAFRLWVYMIRLMEMHLKQNSVQALPFIYPLIIYTGQDVWNAPLDLFSLFGDQQILAREWLLKPFQLLDIQKIKDDEILQRRWCGLVEFALKYRQVRDFKKFLKNLLPWIREIEKIDSSGFSLGKNVLKYVLDGTEAKDFKVFANGIREYLSPELGDEIMTLAQELKLTGIHQGEVAMITRQLKHRFHHIPESYSKLIGEADSEKLLTWSEKILDAKSLEEVFE